MVEQGEEKGRRSSFPSLSFISLFSSILSSSGGGVGRVWWGVKKKSEGGMQISFPSNWEVTGVVPANAIWRGTDVETLLGTFT